MSNATVDGGVRVGDRERESALAHLGRAMSQGYLTLVEYEDRTGRVLAADTTADLQSVLHDLPLGRMLRQDPGRRDQRRAAARRGVVWHVSAYVSMVLICLTVWLVVGLSAGAWYFWPVWPMLGGAIGVVSHVLPVRLYGRAGVSPLGCRGLLR
ncbi:DUF1707 domain-containing protein [Mycobacterium sp. ACS4331]|uniref:DUF1707 domain-containing protein n=1 Tax=Mycobacterium sp. ACS4331 TaxID=1834121 RepID=UPI0007FBC268|nr:DUF1707 domain-containing protein [Mycobacterium sp. ACS4331]OBF18508.1 hypothetical protein A5727_00880 [Mycobacterium sp. ACS4331]